MLEIIIEDDVFLTEDSDIVDTKIHIEYDNIYFPSSTWTDFTFPLLEHWKNNLISARHSDKFSFKLYFLDGSFWLDVYKDEKMGLKIEGINDKGRRKIEFTVYCLYFELLQELYKAFKTFAKVLYNNNLQEGSFSSVYKQTMLSISEIKEILKQD